MSRRIVETAGISVDDLLRMGIPPWDIERTRPTTGYVGGRWSDESPLSALLWEDLRRAYRALRINHRDATMFELHLSGCSLRRIAMQFDCSHTDVRRSVVGVTTALEHYPRLGLLTVIVEQLGGWRAAAEILF